MVKFKMKQIIILIFILSTLTSCVNEELIKKQALYSANFTTTPKGKSVIIGSITLRKGIYANLILENISTKKTYIISSNSKRNSSWSSRAGFGNIYLKELIPGKYKIIGYNYSVRMLNSYKTFSIKRHSNIIFLKEGEMSYLGNINFETLYGKNIFGINIPAGVKTNFLNKQNRDFKAIKKRFPKILFHDTKTNIPNHLIKKYEN
jgi:hypothetical protein